MSKEKQTDDGSIVLNDSEKELMLEFENYIKSIADSVGKRLEKFEEQKLKSFHEQDEKRTTSFNSEIKIAADTLKNCKEEIRESVNSCFGDFFKRLAGIFESQKVEFKKRIFHQNIIISVFAVIQIIGTTLIIFLLHK